MTLLSRYQKKTDIIIHSSRDNTRSSIKYMHANVDWSQSLYRMARGLILDNETSEIVARPYDKFFNYGQILHSDSQTKRFTSWKKGPFTVTLKMDGSLAIMYDYKGELKIASSGTPEALGLKTETLKDLHTGPETTPWVEEFTELHSASTVEKLHELAKTKTLLFEYVTPNHKIVIPYDKTEFILHGMRDTKSGKDYSLLEIKQILDDLDIHDVKMTKIFPEMQNLTDIQKALDTVPGIEGFVIRWNNGDRLKMKTSDYVNAHHTMSLFSNVTTRLIYVWTALYYLDVLDDFVAQFQSTPFTNKNAINTIHELYKAIDDFNKSIEDAKLAIKNAKTRKELYSKDFREKYAKHTSQEELQNIIHTLSFKDYTDERLKMYSYTFIARQLLPNVKVRSTNNDFYDAVNKELDYFYPEHEVLTYSLAPKTEDTDQKPE